jgi:DNA-binding PadR family transcriptional regulator
MATTPRLTSTSASVLGVLAAGPRTAYELIGELERTIGRFLPRAPSKRYEEPKRLVAAGLARGTAEQVGRRRRTRYRITAKGRRALAAWLATPGAAPALESEQLLQVHLADRGRRVDLLATIAAMRAWAAESAPPATTDPFDRLTTRFLFDFAAMVDGWAAWAADEVARWPDDVFAGRPEG